MVKANPPEVQKRGSAKLERVIIGMRKKGLTLREIAAQVHYSYETIRTVLKRSGEWPALARLGVTTRCAIPRCGEKHYAHGYCLVHYRWATQHRMDKKGNLIIDARTCPICGTVFYSPPAGALAQKCEECRRLLRKLPPGTARWKSKPQPTLPKHRKGHGSS
jgi:hypothetical protein